MWHAWTGWGGWISMTVAMVAFWGVITALVVWMVRQGPSGGGRGESSASRRDATSILEARFARGEIDREEFEERREVLRAARRPS